MDKYRITLAFLYILLTCEVSYGSFEERQSPKGHLQPLGSHREPDNSLVDELHDIPTSQEFWEKYVKTSKAVVLRGAAKHSEAFHKWTDKYLKENFGNLEVRLEKKKEKSGGIPKGVKGIGRDTIGNFIDTYHQTNAYIVSELPTPMWKDISVQPCLTCGDIGNRLVEVDLWMSGGGSSSILHKDAFNAINCLYNGTKEWKMIEYKYENMIYKAYEPEREIGGFSRINPLKVDLLKYPMISEVPWSLVTVNAGDCLFLPKSYYHQVTSYGTMNVAVAILFSRFDGVQSINFNGCHSNTTYTPLSEMDMDWKYPGYGNLSMGNPDLNDVRSMLQELLFSGDSPTQSIVNNFKEWYPEKPDEWHLEKAHDILNSVKEVRNNEISKDAVMNLGREELRKIAMAIEPTDLSNTEFHEYTVVSPYDIREVIEQLVDSNGRMDKNKFIDLYQKHAYGTERFAKEIISKLTKDTERTWISQEEITNSLEVAILPYKANQREEHIPPGQTQPEPNDAYSNDETDKIPTISSDQEKHFEHIEF